MLNLNLAEIHFSQLAECDCEVIKMLRCIAANTQDTPTRALLNSIMTEFRVITSEVDMLRASLALPGSSVDYHIPALSIFPAELDQRRIPRVAAIPRRCAQM